MTGITISDEVAAAAAKAAQIAWDAARDAQRVEFLRVVNEEKADG